jgi:Asp-tRNA(Asn)/Glu-tRNA(Gln) amidotransferase A subunit family amidase
LSRALDHVGVFARSLADCALILDALAGYDGEDPDSRTFSTPSFRATVVEDPPSPPRFAFVRTPVWEKADAEARAALEGLVGKLGDAAVTVDLPESFAAAWDDHRVIMSTDMAYNLGEAVERGGEASSKQLRDLLAEGGRNSAVRYLAARANAEHYRAGLVDILKTADAIITLSAPGAAPKGTATGSPVFNSLWTLTGLPAVTIPLLKGEGGLPIGTQLVGAPGEDARLLRTATWLVANFHAA